MKLSIITTLYRSEPYIELFLEKAITAGEAYGGTFEIIVVDDGSTDCQPLTFCNTLSILFAPKNELCLSRAA